MTEAIRPGEAKIDKEVPYEFFAEHAPLFGISYGHPSSIEVQGPNISRLHQLRSDSYLDEPFERLSSVVLWGVKDTVIPRRYGKYQSMIYEAQKLQELLQRDGTLNNEVVALDGLVKSLEQRRIAALQQTLAEINEGIASSPLSVYVVVDTVPLPASEHFTAGYVRHHRLAPFDHLDTDEEGELVTYLRDDEDQVGYIKGTAQLNDRLYWGRQAA